MRHLLVTQLHQYWWRHNMAFIGNTVQTQGFIPAVDYFSGNGSTTAFTLSRPVASVVQVEAVINNVVQDPSTAYTVSGNTLTFTSAPPSGTNNIYVRYTSLITQVIAPSQGTVGWNQLTTDVQQDLGISFKNRIINGAMVIDQRNAGASVTPTTDGQYTVDRWGASISQASKFSVQQNAGSVTPPAGFTNYLGATSLSAYSVLTNDYFLFQQKIEGLNVGDLGWGTANAKTVTLSFWVRSSLTGTFGGSLNNSAINRSYPFSYTVSSANTWEQKSITIAGDTTGTWLTTNGIGLRVILSLGAGSGQSGTAGSWAGAQYLSATGATSVVGTNGATFYITGVQLEVGTQATTFDYRSYGTELALCQRYFISYGGIGANDQIMLARTGGTSNANGVVNLPVTMRTSPTVGYSSVGALTVDDNSVGNATTAIATNTGGYTSVYLNLTTAATLTTNRPALIYCTNSSSRLTWSAEL
ncbi:MAG: hypothetical protein WCO04_18810 [Pseudomonadota bacterium]